ncbi:MAG: radical SAM protein [Thermoleophilia bacterium]
MRYHGAVIRPPSEASSLIVQVTYGCSNDTCDFCGTYLGKPFAVRPFSEVEADIVNLPESVRQQVERVFLADGDALALSPQRLLELLALLRRELPRLRRVSSYATALNLLAKTDDELHDVRAAGLTLIYLGLESGDDETLMAAHKGITVHQQVEGCRRAAQAGIDLSITAILGLAGAERSLLHAEATGAALSAIDPQYIGLLTLMLTPGTVMAERVRRGELVLPDTLGMVRELREIVAHTNVSDCLFRSNHASNYLPVGGRLPQDKDEMLRALDAVLAAPEKAILRPESWRQL